MPSPSILLRLLLCVTLILNGISGATAAVRMAAGHAEHAEQPMAAVPDAGMAAQAMACHGNDAATTAMADMAHSVDPVQAPATPAEPEQCCDSSACQCACVHQSAATIVASFLVAPLPPAVGTAGTLDVSHRAPALPHLIRPPIS